MKNSKITILFVHANNKDIGGADYCLFKLANQLDTNTFRSVVCLSTKTDIIALYDRAGIKTYIIDMERIKKNPNPLYLLKLAVKFPYTIHILRKIIRHEQADIVHGNDLLDIYGPIAGRLENIPTLQYVRWIIVSPLWLKHLLSLLVLGLNSMVLSVSDSVAKQMLSTKNRIHRKVKTCYDWIDMDSVGHCRKGIDLRSEFGISRDKTVVGCIGRLEPWKGQKVFIEAAAEILKRFPQTIFLIVGGDVSGRGKNGYGNHLKALAGQLGIRDKIIFAGHRSDIADVMNSLDIFVHSSVSPDPLPGVVMEAMYCSKPVVAANDGGVPEEVSDGITGFLYKAGDHKQMADKICSLIKNRDLAEKMGAAGKKRVTESFDKSRLCNEIEDTYRMLIKR